MVRDHFPHLAQHDEIRRQSPQKMDIMLRKHWCLRSIGCSANSNMMPRHAVKEQNITIQLQLQQPLGFHLRPIILIVASNNNKIIERPQNKRFIGNQEHFGCRNTAGPISLPQCNLDPRSMIGFGTDSKNS